MKEMKKIKVEFADQTIFEGKDTTKVFIKTLKKVGLDKVKSLNLNPCKVPLISSEKTVTNENNRKYFYTKCDDNNYIMCHTNTEAKLRILKTIKSNTEMIKSVTLVDTSIIDVSNNETKIELVKPTPTPIVEETTELSNKDTFIRIEESDSNWDKMVNQAENVRRMTIKTDPQYVYDNQIDCAKKGVSSFLKGYRWLLLISPMQAGKSATYLSIAYIISNHVEILKTLNIYKCDDLINMFLLTGMSDTELKSQFVSDLSIVSPNLDDRVLSNDDMQKFIKTPRENWTKKMIGIFDNISQNSLIFIDESHFGSSKDQILNKFLELLDIKQNGDILPLKEKNIRVVSISATGYAEHLSESTVENHKMKIILEPGEGYYGLSEMHRDGMLRQSKNLNNDKEIKEILDVIDSIDNVGYCIIRAYTDKQKNKILKIMSKYNFDHILYDSTSKKDYPTIDEITKNKPLKKTIIFVKGMLRAGKVMGNKKNILLTHDTHRSQSDTTAQGLAGRVCGYVDNRHILVYCDIEQAKHWIDWQNNGFDELNPETKGKDVVNSGSNGIKIIKLGIYKTNQGDVVKDFNSLYGKSGVDSKKLELFKKHINFNEFEIEKDQNHSVNISLLSNLIPGKFFTAENEDGNLRTAYINNNGNLTIANGKMDGENVRVEQNVGKYIISPVLNKSLNQVEFGLGLIIQDKKEIKVSSKTGY
jgi:hypothetical protein